MFSVLLSSNKFARFVTSPVLRSQLLCPDILESYTRTNRLASHLKASWTVEKSGRVQRLDAPTGQMRWACHSLVLVAMKQV
jgi:hypothetical protein